MDGTIFIGIDPGFTGAIAAIYPDESVKIFDAPTVEVGGKNQIDVMQLASILRDIVGENSAFCTIEQVNSFNESARGRRQGLNSTFRFGTTYGIEIGMVAMLGVPFLLVPPTRWKRRYQLIGTDKNSSIQKAKSYFPQAEELLRLKKHDGRAEALLIADYGRVERTGEGVKPVSDQGMFPSQIKEEKPKKGKRFKGKTDERKSAPRIPETIGS